jgi:predicted membrane protein
MSKLYITKNQLLNMLTQYNTERETYPKPILTLLAMLLTIIVFVVLFLLIALALLVYFFLFWIDIILGKYIIKRKRKE